MRQTPAIPSFFLFGEAPKPVEHRFLHLECLDDRSRPNAWNIRPHAHADLSHVFHIASGAGRLETEDRVIAFCAPCALLIPAGTVHGFVYEAETTGSVLTVAQSYLDDLCLRDRDLAALFAAPARIELGDLRLAERLGALGQELVWSAPGHVAATEAKLLELMVELLRLARRRDLARAGEVGPQAALVARLRALIEQHYRTAAAAQDYARMLNVTPARLRQACLRVTGQPPARLLRDRRLMEARRALLYSNMTVAEVGFSLGFEDPAYFSRFFAKGVGQPPRRFRAQRAAAGS